MIIFDDVIFPLDIIKMACTGKRKRFTDVTTTGSGFVETNIKWSRTLREFDIGSVARPVPQWDRIVQIHEILDGRAYGCLFQDPTDSLVSFDEGVLRPIDSDNIGLATPGNGYGVPTYRLVKRYAFLSRFKDVDIAKPQNGTVIIRRNGSTVTPGGAAGHFSLDFTTGIVTFVADAAANITAVTAGASTTINLDTSLPLNSGQRIYLNGITGAGASLLNGQSFLILSTPGTGNFIIDVNTLGATLVATGHGYAYPQADDALTWSGTYYVPVSFANDELDWSMIAGGKEDNRVVNGPSIVLQEQRVK